MNYTQLTKEERDMLAGRIENHGNSGISFYEFYRIANRAEAEALIGLAHLRRTGAIKRIAAGFGKGMVKDNAIVPG